MAGISFFFRPIVSQSRPGSRRVLKEKFEALARVEQSLNEELKTKDDDMFGQLYFTNAAPMKRRATVASLKPKAVHFQPNNYFF